MHITLTVGWVVGKLVKADPLLQTLDTLIPVEGAGQAIEVSLNVPLRQSVF